MITVKPRQIAHRLIGCGIDLQSFLIGLTSLIYIADIFVNLGQQDVGRKIFWKLAARGLVRLDHSLWAVASSIHVRQREIAIHVIRIQRQGLLIAMLGASPVFLRDAKFRFSYV